MSQSDFGTINPNTKSGTQLATDLNDFRDALNSLHSGSSRPAYAGAGLLWLDTTGTPWILKLFDGTDDITLGTFNATTNVFAAAGVLASSTDNAVPKFNGTTGALQNSGVIVDDNDGIRVPGNLKLSKGTDIASGTAITIPTNGNFFDVTGTTTIATIGTVAVGTMITLQFDGALTLTHSTDLVLPSAANITTTAGDVATFVEYATGDWICVAYSNVFAFAGTGTGDLLRTDGDGSNLTGIGTEENPIINGDFVISQRGTSFTGGTLNADGKYTLDRWYILSEGNDTIDVTQNTADAPSTGEYCIALDVETTGQKFGVAQIVEAVNCRGLIGQEVTISFKAKVSNARIDTVKAGIVAWSGTADSVTKDIVSTWNADGTTPTLIANATFENTPADLGVTTSWVTYSVTATIDTASAKQIIVFLWSDDATNPLAGDFLYITDVQLKLGSSAGSFARKLKSDILAECQRYFSRTTLGAGERVYGGRTESTSAAVSQFALNKPMRTIPTVSSPDVTNININDGSVNVAAASFGTNYSTGTGQLAATINSSAATLTGNRLIFLGRVSATDAHIDFDAELGS